MEEVIQSGVYRHYKGNLYFVIGEARHTESNEIVVVYMPLYQHPNGGHPLQVRPKSMFCSAEFVDGKRLPRFEYIGQQLSQTSAK